MSDVRWCLRYSDGKVRVETADHSSIRLAPLGALTLEVLAAAGEVLDRVQLDGFRPVFYRARGLAFPASAPVVTMLLATYYGRAIYDRHGNLVVSDLRGWDGTQVIHVKSSEWHDCIIGAQVRGS